MNEARAERALGTRKERCVGRRSSSLSAFSGADGPSKDGHLRPTEQGTTRAEMIERNLKTFSQSFIDLSEHSPRKDVHLSA